MMLSTGTGSSKAIIHSLAFKTLLALAAAALPALAAAMLLGTTLITAVGHAEHDFRHATSAARHLADIRVEVERERGLVSRIPAELDLNEVERYAQQIYNLGLSIDAKLAMLTIDKRISPQATASGIFVTRQAMLEASDQIVGATKSFAQATALKLLDGPFESNSKVLISHLDAIRSDVDNVVENSRHDLEASSLLAWRLTLAALIGASLSVAFGFWMVRRQFIRPLLHLTRNILDIRRSGDLGIAGEIDLAQRNDEIGVLAGSFSQMIAELAEARHRLIAESEAEIHIQYERLNAALDNMAQGLCMFDSQQNIVVSNRRYATLYGLDPQVLVPGMSRRTVITLRAAIGAGPKNMDDYMAGREAAAAARQPWYRVNELSNGRIIAVSYQPMASGGSVTTHEDITERRTAEARIEYLAHYDELTKLRNRVRFRADVDTALSRVEGQDSLAILCLDLDQFKAVNDTLGHPVGDSLLQAVAARIMACVGPNDSVGRLGGDEFAIVQAPTSQAADCSASLAAELIASIAEPYDVDGHQIIVGVSVGIALAQSGENDVDRLLKNADMALYRAKEQGRGTFRFFEPDMDARMQNRRALELDLRKALALEQFEVFYQPIIELERGSISGCEALLRWRHPERGLVSPDQFIPIAEEIGVIVPIGAWVLKQACAEAMGWPEDMGVAVNLSPVQFESNTLVLDVIAALGKSGLPASRLELEITETVLLRDTNATLSILNQLKNLGVRIAMDDFGTGYSSLAYLQRFPFDKIKIDQSFVRNLSETPDSIALVRTITGLARTLRMTTTAEGVETAGQLAQLRDEGCTEVQGYLFSKPKPAHELAALFLELKAFETPSPDVRRKISGAAG